MRVNHLKYIGTGLGLSLLMFVGAVFCFTAKAHSGFNAVLWLPNGISFTSLFLLGPEFWPWIVFGEAASYYWAHTSVLTLITAPFASILINYTVARYLRKKLSHQDPFIRLDELFSFLLFAVVLGPLISSLFMTILFCLGGSVPSNQILETWRAWWFGQGVGTLVVGGFMTNLMNDRGHAAPLLMKRKIEAFFLFLAILGTCLFIFTPLAVYNKTLLIKPYFLYTLMLWVSLRFDVLGASTTSMVMAFTAMAGETLGFVAFTTSTIDQNERMIMLQMVITAISFTGLIVAATVREKTEALDAKNEFLDIASHELKTPITSLKLQLQLLQKRIDKKTELTSADTEQKTFLNKVDRQVNRLVKIVEQLLDVSRAERSLMELDREEVDLNELIQQLTERLAGDFQNAKCKLEIELSPNLKGNWDPFRLEQVLENLLSNAIKYAPGSTITFKALQNGSTVEISVQDHGPGIDPSKQHTIFDRFVRASDVRHVQGLGLGLFITRKIIETHGGTIEVKSALQNGALFTVCLPVSPLSV